MIVSEANRSGVSSTTTTILPYFLNEHALQRRQIQSLMLLLNVPFQVWCEQDSRRYSLQNPLVGR